MSTLRTVRALVGLGLGLTWFVGVGPALGNRVRQLRAEAARSLSVAEIRAALRTTGTRPDAPLAALLDEAAAAEAREGEWNVLVAEVLDPGQRQQALALEPDLAPVPPNGDMRFVEPELPALAEALIRAHGLGDPELPAMPLRDPWPGVDRRRRARGLLALTQLAPEEGLRPEQTQILLRITLDAMAVQVERARIERALGAALSAEVRAAVLEARYAEGPSRPGGHP